MATCGSSDLFKRSMAKMKTTYRSNELSNHPQKFKSKAIKSGECHPSSSPTSSSFSCGEPSITSPHFLSSSHGERPSSLSKKRVYVKSGKYSKKTTTRELESAQFIAQIERHPCQQEQEARENLCSSSKTSQRSIVEQSDASSCDSDFETIKLKRSKKRIPFPKKSEKRDNRNRQLWEVAQKIKTVNKQMKFGVMTSEQMSDFLASNQYVKSVEEFNHFSVVVQEGSR